MSTDQTTDHLSPKTEPMRNTYPTTTVVVLKGGEEIEVPFPPDFVKICFDRAVDSGDRWLNLDKAWLPMSRISYVKALVIRV